MQVQDPRSAAALGRIVVFVDASGKQYPAIVSKVNEDQTIDLVAFGESNVFCQHVEYDETGLRERTWLWPHFMKLEDLYGKPSHDPFPERHVYTAAGPLTTDAPVGQLDLDPSPPDPAMEASAPDTASTIAASADAGREPAEVVAN